MADPMNLTDDEIAHADAVPYALKLYVEDDGTPGPKWAGLYRLADHDGFDFFFHGATDEDVAAKVRTFHREAIARQLRQIGGVEKAKERARAAAAARAAKAKKALEATP